MNRLGLLLAVLQKRHPQLGIGKCDVYINVAGGLRLNEPALDLPLLLAIASSRANLVIPPDWAALGEVGLGGEVRAVSGLEIRLHELHKMGFRCCLVPARSLNLKSTSFQVQAKGCLPESLTSKPSPERMAEVSEEDPIGELTLGPPISDEAFDFSQLGKNPLFKSASQLSTATSSTPQKADWPNEYSTFNVNKTKNSSTEIKQVSLQNNSLLQVVPVENLQQALHILGIKGNRAKNEHFEKKKYS